MESRPRHEAVAERLKSQFAPAYLTVTSIIQGAAVAALAARVESVSDRLDTAGWLLVAATFLSFVLIWHEYLMQSLAYVWLPTLVDSLVPFAFLAAELFAVHFIYGNQRAWLFTMGVGFAVGIVAAQTTVAKARGIGEENAGVLSAVAPIFRIRFVLVAALTVFCFVAGALYDVLRLGQAPLIVPLVALVGIVAELASTVPYWNRVLGYARGEHAKPSR